MLKKAFILLFFVLLLFVLQSSTHTIYAQENREYVIKTALIYNFTKYIEWPQPYKNEEVFTIGIFDNDTELKAKLNELVDLKRVKNRIIEIKVYSPKIASDANSLEYCDMFYISKKNKNIEDNIIQIADRSNTLVVGETENFTEKGGSIGFFIRNNTIGFKINRSIIEKATYKIDPQLLRNAEITNTK